MVFLQLVNPSIRFLDLFVLFHVLSLNLLDVLGQLLVLALHQVLLCTDERLQFCLLVFDDLIGYELDLFFSS